MMKYVVYFENWNDAEEDAERYVAEWEENLTSEEMMYIIEKDC